MSYLRTPVYAYSDGACIHIDGTVIPLEWFDALVAMRWAQMTDREKRLARRRAIEFGEFGGDALRDEMGVETLMHQAFRAAGLEDESARGS